jgi:hypothetical protein
MRYMTRNPLLRYLLPLSLCLVGAHCGDPVSGTWVNSTAPSANQYMTYMATLTFGDAKSVTVDLETARGQGALVYAGCMESLMGTGTYTESGTTVTSTFESGNSARTGCVYAQDNLPSAPINTANTDPKSADAAAVATLVALSSGTFTVANNVLSLTQGSTTLKYTKQ